MLLYSEGYIKCYRSRVRRIVTSSNCEYNILLCSNLESDKSDAIYLFQSTNCILVLNNFSIEIYESMAGSAVATKTSKEPTN